MKIKLLALCATIGCFGAMAETQQVMTVVKTDGTEVSYDVSSVERVVFEEAELPEPTTLNNQYQYLFDSNVHSIGSVVMLQEDGGYRFYIYNKAGIVDASDSDAAFTLWLASSAMGQTLNIEEALTAGTLRITNNIIDAGVQPTGTLTAKFGRIGTQVEISLESQYAGCDFRAAYNGAYTETYSASGLFSVTPAEGTATEESVGSVLRIPGTAGASVNFALGSVEAATASDYLSDDYAVWFSVSASKAYNGDVDLATEKDSYTFRLFDYATGTYDEAVASGTITTRQSTDGRVLIKLNATMESGVVVTAEYYGAVTDVESLDGMIPTPVAPNEFTYTNQGGTASSPVAITSVKAVVDGDYTTFYFLSEGNTDTSDQWTVPYFKVANSLIGKGVLSVADLNDNYGSWELKYLSYNPKAPTSANAAPYSNQYNNGTFSVSVDNGIYTIYVNITNSYTSMYSGSGDKTNLTINYKGEVTE